MSSCSVCGLDAPSAHSFRHRCGHVTHTACMDELQLNYKQCPPCAAGTAPWPDVNAVASTGSSEPRPLDGVDYVMQPGERRGAGSRVFGVISSALTRKAPAEPDPLELLRARTPISVMLKRHKVGLHHVLKHGGDMMDFLGNGYTWRDMQQFEDVGRMGPERAAQVLQALGASANHFRLYPGQLPWSEVSKHCELEPVDLHDRFGLHFPPDGPLVCDGDENWGANDVLRLGLSMDDLIGLGMCHVGQYEDLLQGMSPKRAAEVERQLGATAAHMAALQVDVPEPEQPTPVRQTPRPVATPLPRGYVQAPTPAYLKRAAERHARLGTTHLVSK